MRVQLKYNNLLVLLGYAILSANLYSSPSEAHGENRPGPRGGFVEMPGAYPSEPVRVGRDLRVYLIDIEYRHPEVKNSSVELTYKSAKITEKLKCRPHQDHFSCSLTPKVRKTQGRLELKSMRLGQVGNMVTFSLPLRHESQ
ncbi:MAG: hypothetical protein WCH11_01665 [Bdellovibrio sp.]